jgi:hypothetical protein
MRDSELAQLLPQSDMVPRFQSGGPRSFPLTFDSL